MPSNHSFSPFSGFWPLLCTRRRRFVPDEVGGATFGLVHKIYLLVVTSTCIVPLCRYYCHSSQSNETQLSHDIFYFHSSQSTVCHITWIIIVLVHAFKKGKQTTDGWPKWLRISRKIGKLKLKFMYHGSQNGEKQ